MYNKYEKSSVTPGQKCEIIKSKEARRRDLQTHRRILKMEQKKPKTMFEKIWDAHVVREVPGESPILYIDRHLVHEMTSPQAFAGLRLAGRTVHRPDATIAVLDHNVPTVPGMTIVCGDSHTSTHGALGALAFGIGTSEVEHVLATQCLLQNRPKTMQVRVEGTLAPGVTAKDLALAIIGKLGTGIGTGHVIEFSGSTIRNLSMEGRMTLCNMAVEAGARAGMVAPDEITFT